MTDLLLKWLDAGQTPLLALLTAIVWRIKTNDLHEISERLSRLEGINEGERAKKGGK